MISPFIHHLRTGKRGSWLATMTIFIVLGMYVAVPYVLAGSSADTPNPAPTSATGQSRTLQDVEPSTNPNDSAFRISVCDGPTLPTKEMTDAQTKALGREYIPCDFNAVMLLIQHVINIMLILGVLVSIIMFMYAGTLYLSGQKDKIDKAHTIFPKIFIGFIIMLSAWFIVYQILSWLTDEPGFTKLLGSPK